MFWNECSNNFLDADKWNQIWLVDDGQDDMEDEQFNVPIKTHLHKSHLD